VSISDSRASNGRRAAAAMQFSGDIATLIAAARAQKRHILSEPESKALLRAQGIAVPAGRVVRSAEEAPGVVEEIGAPVVVKAVAHQLTHKTEAGAVMFPVDTPAAAQAACRTIAERVAGYRADIVLEGFLIEAFRPAQPEWILALRNDPNFGPAIMFGLGGIYVETLRQVTFRLAPLREQDIEALMSERPATTLLEGARGRPPSNRRAVGEAMRRLSDLSQQPQIRRDVSEIEINPLRIDEQGVLALDALVVLRPQ
jgi:succinyl-CoA synthetase beta subunit